MSKLFNDIHYFRIPVVNVAEAIKWYSECLQLELRFNRGDLAVFNINSGPLLVLVEADQDSRGHFTIDGQPAFSVSFTTSKINELHHYLDKNEVKIEPIRSEHGHQFFYFYDPDGNKLQVHN
ncbi:lactoylglutathione lyase [Pontibacillus halophilus JSM 076056 = DSM 19796]|uniref:Lactoylglutathione lyase n=1 Tax=Pontibacillus halophilus JSM 076056 = DSM 19796 TaxID=1385510 RepID=A0A0A5GIP6_9BACI|nr:VOC family protein [Pontibacillus halophilus]KGX91093.1 lactoylglutathione lyase [Pontibacillus halophilus JSM 076056 = DSM 19796]